MPVLYTYQPDNDRVPRIRAAIDWIKACFDTRAFPFFGEEYIYHKDLTSIDGYEMLPKMYSGLVM